MKRRNYTNEFKFKVVIEALETGKMTEAAKKYGINFSLLAKWKDQFMKNGAEIFGSNKDIEKDKMKKKVQKLEQMIGQKEVELNLLKNFSDFYESQSTP